MSTDFEKVKARYNRAKIEQQRWVSQWEEAYNYTQPNRNAWDARFTTGQQKGIDVFDTTPEAALDAFVSKIQSALTPIGQKWMKVIAGDEVPADQKETVNQQLENVTNILFKKLHNSNFDMVANEAYYDLAIGTSALIINESDDDDAPFEFEAVSMFNYYPEQGANNTVKSVYRDMYGLTYDAILELWPLLKLPVTHIDIAKNDPAKKIDMSEGVVYDRKTKKHTLYVWSQLDAECWYSVELKESPWVISRWSKVATEVFGRGPVLKSLPSIKSLNKLAEYELMAAAMASNPAWMVYSDGLMNPFNNIITPGGQIVTNQSPANNAPLKALEGGGNIRVGQFTIDDLRNQVKTLMFAKSVTPEGGPVISATEVSIKAKEIAQVIGPAFGRQMVEWVAPIVKRCLSILIKRGLIPKFELNGKQATLDLQSPIATGQKLEQLVAFQQMSSTLISTVGPELAPVALNIAELPSFLAEVTGVPLNLIKDEESLKQLAALLMKNVMGQQAPAPGAQRGVGDAPGNNNQQLETAGI